MEIEGKLKKYERTTQGQLQFFITFSKQYPDILKNSYGAKGSRIHDLWIILANSLNDMRGPTRTPDKWKECLKNRINQIRCRARKSMLGWNRRSAGLTIQKKVVDDDGDLGTVENSTPEMDEQSSLMSTIPPNQVNSYETLSSSYDDGNIVKDEIPSIDLDSTGSNQSFPSLDIEADSSMRFSDDYLNNITQEQLKMFVAFAKQHASSNNTDTEDFWGHMADTLNGAGRNTRSRSAVEWKESLLIWENQLRTRASFDDEEEGPQNYLCELEQEALHMLHILATNEKNNHSTNIQRMQDELTTLDFQTPQETIPKKEPSEDDNHYNTSDNEDLADNEKLTNRIVLNCGATPTNSRGEKLQRSSSESLPNDFIDLLRESIKKWDEREERAIVQQKLVTNALELLNKSLESMTNAIEKFNEKLDKL